VQEGSVGTSDCCRSGPRLDEVPYDVGFIPELGRYVIVAHVLEHDALGVVHLLVPEPDGPVLTIPERKAPFDVVGYRDGLTPEVMKVLRAPARPRREPRGPAASLRRLLPESGDAAAVLAAA
jgi:hypothetical protein